MYFLLKSKEITNIERFNGLQTEKLAHYRKKWNGVTPNASTDVKGTQKRRQFFSNPLCSKLFSIVLLVVEVNFFVKVKISQAMALSSFISRILRSAIILITSSLVCLCEVVRETVLLMLCGYFFC